MVVKRKGLLRQEVLFIDLICIVLLFVLLSSWNINVFGPIRVSSYISALFIVVLSYGGLFMLSDEQVDYFIKRGYLKELLSSIKKNIIVAFVFLVYVLVTGYSSIYSVLFFGIFFGLNTILIFIVHSIFKVTLLRFYRNSTYCKKVLLITTQKQAWDSIEQFESSGIWDMKIDSLCFIDSDLEGEQYKGIPILANIDNVLTQVRLNAVDDVLIQIDESTQKLIHFRQLIHGFEKMGITVHVAINMMPDVSIENKKIGNLAGYHVVTFFSNIFNSRLMLVKRLFDIVGSVIGILCTALLTIVLAPLIFIEDPGPIFFSQTRIGMNGRRFKLYKFRSMVMNAEEMKKDLLDQNEINGLMFKMKDDPRITKVGRFIRKFSLDEFPQFFNVLKGDMSLVGTRPPTEDEFELYTLEYRKRLSIRPGLTGLWQVSGRSDIDNFDEVVRMDLEYIDQWSLINDLKLILKTIWVVLFGRGAK